MTLRVTPDAPSRDVQSAPQLRYRHDLDGLRALAVLLIVVYHVWVGRVSGGVDVFLMLSAFFLTASFAKRAEAGGAIAPLAYWTKTFKRLLPAAAVVLLGVLAATALLLPATRWPTIWSQTVASLFYFQNWELASTAVDYYAPHGAMLSPLQHFWSMSIQGQIFVLWPLLILGGTMIARRLGRSVRLTLVVVFGIVFAASLSYSIVITAVNQQWAYFDTGARLWEFALGSLVALVLPYVKLPEPVRAVLGWAGLAGIVLCGVLFDVEGGFPGYLALWPTMCAAMLIVAGSSPTRFGPDRLLAFGPLRWLGNSAYALYLVHWPILVFWMALAGRGAPGPIAGAAIIGASIAIAIVVHLLVERPLREFSWGNRAKRNGLVVIAASLAIVVVPLGGWQLQSKAQTDALVAAGDHPGALVLDPTIGSAFAATSPPLPDATALDDEWVSLPDRCDGRFAPHDEVVEADCAQFTPDGPITATVVVVGDSHSEQMMGALIPVAERSGWELVSVLRGGCSFGLEGGRCPSWSAAVLDYLLDIAPDAVFTVGTAAEVDGPGERVTPGLESVALRLVDEGIAVLAVRDNPRFSYDVYECAFLSDAPLEECGTTAEAALAAVNPLTRVGGIDGVYLVDFTDQICPDGICAPQIGNVYVYRDDNHLTKTYAETLAGALQTQLAGVLPR